MTIGWVVGDPTLAEVSGPDPAILPARAFLHGLRDLGWIEGRTITIVRRSAESRRERVPEILAEFMARRVDVIFTGATDWLVEAAHTTTRTVPMVALFDRDSVATGLVASLGRPGGNLTGLTTTTGRELYEKRLQFFTELAPPRSPAWLSLERGLRGRRTAARLIRQWRRRYSPRSTKRKEFDQAFAIVLRERLITTSAKLVRHARYAMFQMAEAALPRQTFASIVALINGPRGAPAVTMSA